MTMPTGSDNQKPKYHAPEHWDWKPSPEELAARENLTGWEITARTGIREWVEIARDCFAAVYGRRPRLLTEEDIAFLESEKQEKEYAGTFWPHFGRDLIGACGELPKEIISSPDFDTLPFQAWQAREAGQNPKHCWERFMLAYHQQCLDAGITDPPLYTEEERNAALDEFTELFSDQVPRPSSGTTLPETGTETAEELQPHPYCAARCHIPHCFNVYDFAVSVSRKNGTCWLSRRMTSKWCGGIDGKTARRAITYLVATGWLIELKAPEDGKDGAGQYRVVLHEEWVKQHGDAQCVRESKRGKSAALQT